MNKKKGRMRRIRQGANQWRIPNKFALKSFGWLIDEIHMSRFCTDGFSSTIVTIP